jgi:hypothetical protein
MMHFAKSVMLMDVKNVEKRVGYWMGFAYLKMIMQLHLLEV